MAHGGTNFGFYNGANTGADEFDYKPDLTSYDYVRKINFDFIVLRYCIFTYPTYQSNVFSFRMHQLENLVMWTMQSSKVCAKFSYVSISFIEK